MTLDAAITPLELSQHLADFPPPTLVDVRRQTAFDRDPHVIPGALRRLPEVVDDWAGALEPWRTVVVYCVRGHEVGKDAAEALRAHGFQARYLTGGLEQWRAEGHPTKPHVAPTRWVTRERPKIDRIACPWLVRRFIDPTAEFFYVPKSDVQAFADANNATATTSPRCRTDTRDRNAASMHSSGATSLLIPRSRSSQPSSAAPTRQHSILLRRPLDCSPCRAGSRECSPTIMKC